MESYLLKECINKLPVGCELEILQQIDSTNEYLKRKLKESKEKILSPKIAVAVQQTAGRGTKGRTWIDFGNCLKFSILVPFEGELSSLSLLTPFIALNLLQTLTNLSNGPIYVKWPNDLYSNGGKCIGILTEACKKDEQLNLIIGVGINLLKDEKVDRATRRRTGALTTVLPQRLLEFRTKTFVQAANSVLESVGAVPNKLSDEFIEHWKEFDLLIQKKISLTEGGHPLFEGKSLGIDSSGRILLDDGCERKAFAIGEASVKL